MPIQHISAPISRTTVPALCALALIAATPLRAQDAAAAPPRMQLSAEQREYKEAYAIHDPEKKIAAFRAFIKNNPHNIRIYPAESVILETLVKNFPDRVHDIHQVASDMIADDTTLEKKYLKEYYIAGMLAEAEPNGVDLASAEAWGKESVSLLNEADFIKQAKATDVRFKMPVPSDEALHRTFAKSHAQALASLANVYLDEGRIKDASDTLAQAFALTPNVSKVSLLMARIALLQHDKAAALEDLERAQLLGGLKEPWASDLKTLYAEAHGGSDAGLVESQDAQYRRMFPSPFTPADHTPASGGHAVLLELFTGSGCAPCVAGDLAVEALLQTHTRAEVVVLEEDLHIPEPDPLANPDTVARSVEANVGSTPTFAMDGVKMPLHGNTREESEKLYGSLTQAVDVWQAKLSPVQLSLHVQHDADGHVRATAQATVAGIDALRHALAEKPSPVTADTKAAAPAPGATAKSESPSATTSPEPSTPPSLHVTFALVEDDVRYSGENGMRFHRMVVRSISSPADGGQTLAPASTATLSANFDPAAISSKLSSYLDDYEQNNTRFGKIHFMSKDTSMVSAHLAVAVWVEDSATHRVLQAAFAPVPSALKASEK